jgi:hypothetical protein
MDRKFKSLYSSEEIGFTLIAALAHDVNHQGTNNLYEIKMNTQLARIANNESVLEKMHIRTFFSIVRTKNINLLDKASNPTRIKELITRTILATDLAKHFKGLDKLKEERGSPEFDPRKEETRMVNTHSLS